MKLIFELVAQDVNVGVELQKQRDALKALNKELKGLDEGTEKYNKLKAEAVKTKLAISDLTQQQKELNNAFKAAKVPTDSLAGLRLEYSKLTAQLATLSAAERNSDFGKGIIKNAAKVKLEIDGIEQSVGRFTGNVGNYQSALQGALGFGGIAAALSIAAIAGRKFVDINAEISDKIADVAKAADASITEINALSEALEKRDTRTSLVDQLGIAEIGGKLGVAKTELLDFTASVDTLNVALGDQFGGSAEQTTDVVGKLRNVLTDIKSDKISEDILRIGNALNYLEAQGAASAGNIADFTTRISGAATPLGVSSGKIIGLSATLDELGINAERGSTASVRLLQRIATAPEAFARAIDEPSAKFKKLVNDDIFGALTLFINKLNDKNLTNTALSDTLKTLDVDGAGVSEVIGKLGGNMDLLAKRVDQAGAALGNTNSITSEFEKKNNTFGASVDKLTNSFSNLFTNSNLSSGLAKLTDGLTGFINSLASGADKLTDFTGATNGVTAGNNILSDSLSNATQEIAKESIATEKNFGVLKNDKATREQRNAAIGDLLRLYPDILSQQELEKASVAQLEVIQRSLTNTLRDQVTERAKLRAKEGIQAEILQRQLRSVELEATPNRALVGELSFGEVGRLFKDIGVIEVNEIDKARQLLKVYAENDIAALENRLKQVDSNFNSIINNRENQLSDFEQDQLDRSRQFAGRNSDTAKSLDKVKESTDSLSKAELKANKERKLTEGSIEFLKKRVSDLTTLLERAPQNQVPKILGDLVKAEEDLKAVEERLKELRNPTTEAQTIKRFEGLAATELGAPDKFVEQELTDTEREAAVELGQIRIDEEQFTDEQILALRKALSDKTIGLTKDEFAERERMEREAAEKRKRDREQIEDALFDSGIAVTNAIADERTRAIEDEKTERLSALEIEYEKRKEAAQGNAQLLLSIDEDYQKKKAEIEKEAARERKRVAIIESIIAGALSVVKALPNVPLAIATGIAAATQTAIIASKKFAFGGFTGKGNKHDETGERVAGTAVLHEDEYVAPRAQVQQYPHLFNWLDRNRPKRGASRGYGFAVGGFSEPPAVSFSSAQATKEQALSLTAVAVIDEASARLIAKYVGEQTYSAVAQGIGDADRTNERKQKLTEYTEV